MVSARSRPTWSGTSAWISYGAYLHLDELLDAQHPSAEPCTTTSCSFIVQHRTSELWLTPVLRELRAAQAHLDGDALRAALMAQMWFVPRGVTTATPRDRSAAVDT